MLRHAPVSRPCAYRVKTACTWMNAPEKPYFSNMVPTMRSLLAFGFSGGSAGGDACQWLGTQRIGRHLHAPVSRMLHSVGSTCRRSWKVWSHTCSMSSQLFTTPGTGGRCQPRSRAGEGPGPKDAPLVTGYCTSRLCLCAAHSSPTMMSWRWASGGSVSTSRTARPLLRRQTPTASARGPSSARL